MTYRSLLVHLDGHARCDVRVDVAMQLAQRFEAHLVGLAPTGLVPMLVDAGPGMADEETLALAMRDLHRRASLCMQRFDERCRTVGLRSIETVVDEEETASSIVHHAHCSDLVVIGQGERAASRSMVEQVVLDSARPTLVVPYAGSFDTLGERVVVAWNDSPEAARALADAMPVLTRAQQVHLMQFQTPLDIAQALTRQRLEAVRRWLAWHGVEAQAVVRASEIDVGNALLSQVADLGADLIVMGAWGHPRWSERLLGGATRTLLGSMTVPVLMSH